MKPKVLQYTSVFVSVLLNSLVSSRQIYLRQQCVKVACLQWNIGKRELGCVYNHKCEFHIFMLRRRYMYVVSRPVSMSVSSSFLEVALLIFQVEVCSVVIIREEFQHTLLEPLFQLLTVIQRQRRGHCRPGCKSGQYSYCKLRALRGFGVLSFKMGVFSYFPLDEQFRANCGTAFFLP